MKVILSRKGFDSSAGGYPSPVFVNDGRLLSLPIPEENKIYCSDTGRTYSDLLFDQDTTYLDIMNQLGMKGFAGKNVHLDPDINQHVLRDRKPGWKGMFGQCDTAQQHLSNNHIQPGDLFLFFGWFRDVKKINGNYKYVFGTDKHIIWGYMQVGEVDSISQINEYETWKLDHPHYRNRDRKYNTGYIARKNLNFNMELPGYGIFTYDDSLVLTDANQNNRTIWKLPNFFHPSYGTKMTYHENQEFWKLDNNHCILKSVGRGQEFVITENDNVVEWAKNLILRGKQFQKESDDCPFTIREDNEIFTFEANNIVSMTCYRNATNKRFIVQFNLEDIDKVRQFDKWKVEKNNNKVYANIGTVNTYLHRLIYGDCEGKKVIARNGNYFDCRRENLFVKP